MKEKSLLNLLDDSGSVFTGGYSHIYQPFGRDNLKSVDVPSIRKSILTSVQEATSQEKLLDTYEIQHGLTDNQIRILFKILARDLDDCGRKRGAILRYIKHYEENQRHLGDKKLFATLQALDLKVSRY
jgi:hypothetical protein